MAEAVASVLILTYGVTRVRKLLPLSRHGIFSLLRHEGNLSPRCWDTVGTVIVVSVTEVLQGLYPSDGDIA
jgi:hypothetical protein